MADPLAAIQQALMTQAQHGIPLVSAVQAIATRLGVDPLMVRAVADSMVTRVRPVGPRKGTA